MSQTPDAGPDQPQQDLVRRPPGQLHDFPIEVRWEVTRRHPYYLTFWEEVRRYRRGQPDDPPERKLLGFAATFILGAIGVSGEPVSPATPFADLIGADSDPGFLCGAVQPMTLRSMVAMLLTALPAADRAFVGALLLTSGSDEYQADRGQDVCPGRRSAEVDTLVRTPSPALDACPAAPCSTSTSGRPSGQSSGTWRTKCSRWKARRGAGSSKVHTAKLSQYLQVWDLREGWANGGYDRSRERSFAAIARRLKKPLSTVATHYRTAFAFIVGHAFSPGLWWRLFGPLKFSPLFGDATAAYSAGTRRRLQSPVARPVPDSVVSPAGDAARTSSTVERGSAAVDDAAYRDLLIDLQDLIARGLSDGEIARRLDLKDPLLVAAFRRASEALQLVSP